MPTHCSNHHDATNYSNKIPCHTPPGPNPPTSTAFSLFLLLPLVLGSAASPITAWPPARPKRTTFAPIRSSQAMLSPCASLTRHNAQMPRQLSWLPSHQQTSKAAANKITRRPKMWKKGRVHKHICHPRTLLCKFSSSVFITLMADRQW